jgi:hypothetical protein
MLSIYPAFSNKSVYPIPKWGETARMVVMEGFLRSPLSMREISALLSPDLSANSRWDNPFASRRLRMYSPNVMHSVILASPPPPLELSLIAYHIRYQLSTVLENFLYRQGSQTFRFFSVPFWQRKNRISIDAPGRR